MTGLAASIGGRLRRGWSAYRLRWKRRELLWRAIRARKNLTPVADRTAKIGPDGVLVFVTLRNELGRLPEFLTHYRRLGVSHFLVVDNDSDDGTTALLRAQPDVSLWRAAGSYRDSRFGMDWLGALLMRYGHGHWCVTVDADELLVYPDCDGHDLRELTTFLGRRNIPAIGGLMLDLYPRGPLGRADAPNGAPLADRLPFFDEGPYRCRVQQPRRNRWVQGGARERCFFADRPERSPTLNKLPLVLWNRRYAYVNSTHSMLPPSLNDLYDGPADERLSCVLLHSKFLPEIVAKSREELDRRQHFNDPDLYTDYHRRLALAPTLWHAGSCRYEGTAQLEALGLMHSGDWSRREQRG
ncbi:glycosyltransferase family 2 protein [Paracoccus sp. Z330]|uniref:Glycosyltransferase family 2 protein n=1 Tax=Paracoccus onchidii TaxID=3017813 RepID=A0ABT4ZCM2_9RHOB|nr:glycosyltransferase family 2 protein [Paracoccus onchidii]MDB6177104.1 glycosyltransferase family 2 protein [Paracoccus onchidii]